MADIFEAIDLAYTSVNIYNSVIVYQDNSTDINELQDLLTEHLYPWVAVDCFDESFDCYIAKYRMFLIRSSDFCQYLYSRSYDLSDVSIIICTHDVFDYVCDNMKDISTNEDIILLSVENKNSV